MNQQHADTGAAAPLAYLLSSTCLCTIRPMASGLAGTGSCYRPGTRKLLGFDPDQSFTVEDPCSGMPARWPAGASDARKASTTPSTAPAPGGHPATFAPSSGGTGDRPA